MGKPLQIQGQSRKSILLALGEKTVHRLPEDFVNAGIFEELAMSSLIDNEAASIRVTELVQNHLDAVRYIMEDKDEELLGDD